MIDWVFHTGFEKRGNINWYYSDQGITAKFLEQFGESLEKYQNEIENHGGTICEDEIQAPYEWDLVCIQNLLLWKFSLERMPTKFNAFIQTLLKIDGRASHAYFVRKWNTIATHYPELFVLKGEQHD